MSLKEGNTKQKQMWSTNYILKYKNLKLNNTIKTALYTPHNKYNLHFGITRLRKLKSL